MPISLGPLVYKHREVGIDDASAELLEDVLVNYEAVIFRGGRIFPESFAPDASHRAHWQRPSRYGWFLVRNYVLRRGVERVDSALWVIDDMSIDNYYHWLIDCLARLVHAEALTPEVTTLLLPRHFQRNPFVEFTLRAFPRITVRWIDQAQNIRAGRLSWIPRKPPYYRADHPVFDRGLVTEVARRVGEVAGLEGSGRRLYFSRATAPRRRAANEAEVVRVLQEHDVEIIQIDGSKPWEQVRASRSAELIVGVHGAALSNLIFLPPHGRLLELHRERRGDDHFYDVFRYLAQDMAIAYTGQPSALAKPIEDPETNHADIVVDLDLLRENLRQL